MEEFVPYILILASWSAQQPGKVEMEKIEGAYPSLAACEADGRAIAEYRSLYVDENGKRTVIFHCAQSASFSETEAAWQSRQKEIEARRAEREKEDQK